MVQRLAIRNPAIYLMQNPLSHSSKAVAIGDREIPISLNCGWMMGKPETDTLLYFCLWYTQWYTVWSQMAVSD